MKEDSALHDKTSRRAFTKSVIATLASAPIAASMISCGKQGGGQPETAITTTASPTATAATPTPTPGTVTTDGCTVTSCDFPVQPADHIPPMGIDGGGSVSVETKNKFKRTGSGPFTYLEDDGIGDDDRFGDITKARIITETDTKPFVTDVAYTGFLPGTQLFLWYQDISAQPVDPDDTTFPPATFPDNDPTVRIVGGKGADHFKLVIKKKSLTLDKSHKRHRPHRYKHTDGSGLARHFRIGQWRFVDKDGKTLCQHSGAENYRFFLFFGDFQP